MRALLASLAVVAACLTASDAVAAPQVLGLTASYRPITLTCDDENCTAIVGTFCLQRERALPTYGTPYEASRPERLQLALLTREGTVLRVAGGPWIAFSAYSDYTLVRMTVPYSLLAANDASAVAVEIGPGVSLIPAPQVGDRNPQTADEVALATGPLRLAATRYLDRPSPDMDAARLVAALVNALPESRTIHDDNSSLWQDTITEDLVDAVGAAPVDRAGAAYDRCHRQPNLRHCLIARHREFMMDNNKRYWDESAGY